MTGCALGSGAPNPDVSCGFYVAPFGALGAGIGAGVGGLIARARRVASSTPVATQPRAASEPPLASPSSPAAAVGPLKPLRWDTGVAYAMLVTKEPHYSGRYSATGWGLTGTPAADLFIGRFVTRHLTTDLGVIFGASRESGESYDAPELPPSAFAFVDKTQRHTIVAPALTYHGVDPVFRFHVYLSAGVQVDLLQQRRTVDQRVYTIAGFTYAVPGVDERVSSAQSRPFLAGGTKFSLGRRAFLRPEIRAAFSARGVTHAVVGAAVGTRF